MRPAPRASPSASPTPTGSSSSKARSSLNRRASFGWQKLELKGKTPMGGFQTVVNTQPAPAVEGDFCNKNPRFSVDAGPGGLIAGDNGVVVGRFAWLSYEEVDANEAPAIVNNFGAGPPAGFVHREQQGLITGYLQESSMLVPTGFPDDADGARWPLGKEQRRDRSASGHESLCEFRRRLGVVRTRRQHFERVGDGLDRRRYRGGHRLDQRRHPDRDGGHQWPAARWCDHRRCGHRSGHEDRRSIGRRSRRRGRLCPEHR